MIRLEERTPLHIPDLHYLESDGITYALDPEAPNWIAVEERGASMLDEIRGRHRGESPLTFGSAVARYAAQYQLEAGKAWVHVHDFLRALDRADACDEPFRRPVPRPRGARRAEGAPRALAPHQQRLQPRLHALPRLVGSRTVARESTAANSRPRRPGGGARPRARLRDRRRAVPSPGL